MGYRVVGGTSKLNRLAILCKDNCGFYLIREHLR
jgi:hypothetical protein